MKMRRNNRKTRVNKPRNWIRREREFRVFFTDAGDTWQGQGRRGERRIDISRNSLRMEFDESLTRGYVAQRKNFFSAQSICSPLTLPRPSKAPVFGVSVQRPWPMARGGANELRRRVTRKHVVISYARVEVCNSGS